MHGPIAAYLSLSVSVLYYLHCWTFVDILHIPHLSVCVTSGSAFSFARVQRMGRISGLMWSFVQTSLTVYESNCVTRRSDHGSRRECNPTTETPLSGYHPEQRFLLANGDPMSVKIGSRQDTRMVMRMQALEAIHTNGSARHELFFCQQLSLS